MQVASVNAAAFDADRADRLRDVSLRWPGVRLGHMHRRTDGWTDGWWTGRVRSGPVRSSRGPVPADEQGRLPLVRAWALVATPGAAGVQLIDPGAGLR